MRRHDEQLLVQLRDWKMNHGSIGTMKSAIVAWCEATLRFAPSQQTASQRTVSFRTSQEVVDLATTIAGMVNDGSQQGESLRECFCDVAADFALRESGDLQPEERTKIWETHGTIRSDETFAEGRYIVFEPPIASGESEVWKVLDVRTSKPAAEARIENDDPVKNGRFVAMKRPKRSALRSVRSSHQAAERLLAEARRASLLEHPNICPVYDVFEGTEEEAPYYTMRFLEDATLEDAIHGTQSFVRSGTATMDTWRRVVGYLHDAASGIAYAHSQGFAHLDLKPKNIAVTTDNGTQVLDWGMASRLEAGVAIAKNTCSLDEDCSLPQTSQSNWGTPAYAAPEQWLRLACSPRTDGFQLGAILFEIMTGRPPLGVHSSDFTHLCGALGVAPSLDRILASELRGDRRLAQLASICKKALQPNPRQRYASVSDFQEDLRHWLADEPISTFSETISSHIARYWRKFRPAIIAAGIVLGTLTSAAIIFYSSVAKEARKIVTSLEGEIGKLITEAARLQGQIQELGMRIQTQTATIDQQLKDTRQARDEQAAAEKRADESLAGVATRTALSASRLHQLGEDVSNSAWVVAQIVNNPGTQTGRIRNSFVNGFVQRIGTRPPETRLKAHTGRVIALWYSHDGSELRTASVDGTIRLWNTSTHQVTRIIPIHQPNSAGFVGLDIATSDGKHRVIHVVPHSPSSEISPPVSVDDEIVAVGDLESNMELASGFDQQGIIKRINGVLETDVALKIRSSKSAKERTITLRRRAITSPFAAGELNRFSPDGEWLAVTVGQNRFAVVNVESGRIQWASPQGNGSIAALSFTPDSRQVAWGEADINPLSNGTVKIVDFQTGKITRQIRHGSSISGLGFDPTGNKVFAHWSTEGSLEELDLRQPIASALSYTEWENHRAQGIQLMVSPSGKWLFHGGAAGRDVNVLYDVIGRRPAFTVPNSGSVNAVAFDRFDQLVAVGEQGGTTRILAVEGGNLLATRNGKNVGALVFAPHDETLAIGDGDDICLWRYREGDAGVRSQLVNAPNSITAATFDEHSGKLLVARRGINMMGIVSPALIEFYRHSTGNLVERWPEPSSVTFSADLSPDGSKAVLSRRSFVLGKSAQIDFVDLDTGMSRTISADCPNVASLTWTKAGQMFVADNPAANFFKQFEVSQSRWPFRRGSLQYGDLAKETLSFVSLRDQLTGLLVNPAGNVVIGLGNNISLRDPVTLEFKRDIPIVCGPTNLTRLSPDGRWLAVLNPQDESWLYDLAADRTLSLPGTLPGQIELEFAADSSKLLVIDNESSKLRIYQMPNGVSVEPPVEKPVTGLATSPRSQQDGNSFFLWAGKKKTHELEQHEVTEGSIIEISAETGEVIRVIGREDGFSSITSPAKDGQSLVSANSVSGQLKRWNLQPDWPIDKPRWKEVISSRPMPPFDGDIQALAVSPDGETLVIALDAPGAADAIGGFQLQTWDFSRKKLLVQQPSEPGRVAEIVFIGNDGERFAVRGKRKKKSAQLLGINLGSDHPLVGFAQCWDRATGKRISELMTPPLSIYSMPDTTHQYSAVLRESGLVTFVVQEIITGTSRDSTAPTVGIWNLNTGERDGTIPQAVLGDFCFIICSCQTAQGERLAVELTGSRHPDFLRSLVPTAAGISERNGAFSRTKQTMIAFWDVPRLIREPQEKRAVKEYILTEQPPFDVFVAMTIDPTGSLLAGVSVRGECSVHDLSLGLQALQLPRVDSNPFHLSFSADGHSLAIVSQSESVICPVGSNEKHDGPPTE